MRGEPPVGSFIRADDLTDGINWLILRFMVGSRQQFGDQSHQDGLEAQNGNHDGDGEQGRGKWRDPGGGGEAPYEEEKQGQETDGHQSQACAAKQINRFAGVTRQEFDREKVEDDLKGVVPGHIWPSRIFGDGD